MAQKSTLSKTFWWIPACELDSKQPTAFRVRQMSKRDFDNFRHKNQLGAMIPIVLEAIGEGRLEEDVKDIFTRKEVEEGFDSSLYGNCVMEIKNIYVDGDFKETVTDKAEIIQAIAGLEELAVSDELDEMLWRRSQLEEFETANFTPSSGSNLVCRTVPENPTNDPSTVKNAEPGRIGLRPDTTAAEEDTVSDFLNRQTAPS